MRIRLATLLLPLVLLLALPGATLAGGSKYSHTVERNVCTAGAGQFGFGLGKLRVRLVEYGLSGANRFTYKAKVQHKGLHGSTWRDEYHWDRFKSTFPDDADSYWNSRVFTYAPRHDAYHRIVVVVKIWHNRQLLFARTIRGVVC